jgi:hypothetical protein
MKTSFLLCVTSLILSGTTASLIAQEAGDSTSGILGTSQVSIEFQSDADSEPPALLSEIDAPSPIEPVLESQPVPAPPQPLPDPVDTILQNSAAPVPSGTDFAPAYWSGYGRAPNPLADYMRSQWCVDGLWDSHAAERAAQCAKQAYRISCGWRHNCGCGAGCCGPYCGHCANTCNGCCTAGCLHGRANHPPVNRYLLLKQKECDSSCDLAAGLGLIE